MTARGWIERQYAFILPPGVPLPWIGVETARYTALGRYPRVETTVVLWDGTRATLAVEGTPDYPAVQWLDLARNFQWTGERWAWVERGEGDLGIERAEEPSNPARDRVAARVKALQPIFDRQEKEFREVRAKVIRATTEWAGDVDAAAEQIGRIVNDAFAQMIEEGGDEDSN